MKALVVGHCFSYRADGYASPHGSEARDIGWAHHLASHGYDVHLVATTMGPTSTPNVTRVLWEEVVPNDYELVLLSGVSGHLCVKSSPCADVIREHTNVWGAFDAIYAETVEMDYLRGAGLSSPQSVYAYRSVHPNQRVFYLPWSGMTCVPLDLPSPYVEERPRAIYTGIVRERYLELINQLAEDGTVEVWIAGLFLRDGIFGGLTDQERSERCHSAIRFISDAASYGMGHGPVRYGDHFPYLVHAQVGLNFTLQFPMDVVSCKLYDYLGSGLRVVAEDGMPNNGDVVTLRAGSIVPFNEPETFCRAVASESRLRHDRALAVERAHAMCSWDDTVDRLLIRAAT